MKTVQNKRAKKLKTLEEVKAELENAFTEAQQTTMEEAKRDINEAIELAKKRSETIVTEGIKLSEAILQISQKFESDLNKILEKVENSQEINVEKKTDLTLEDVALLMM